MGTYGKTEALVHPDSNFWSKIETSWNSVMFSQKDAPSCGELSEPSFLVDMLRDLFIIKNPRCVVSPFRVAVIPC